MQKLATKIFMHASVSFGILGTIMVWAMEKLVQTAPEAGDILGKLLATNVFVILTSFALSVATKYLSDKTA